MLARNPSLITIQENLDNFFITYSQQGFEKSYTLALFGLKSLLLLFKKYTPEFYNSFEEEFLQDSNKLSLLYYGLFFYVNNFETYIAENISNPDLLNVLNLDNWNYLNENFKANMAIFRLAMQSLQFTNEDINLVANSFHQTDFIRCLFNDAELFAHGDIENLDLFSSLKLIRHFYRGELNEPSKQKAHNLLFSINQDFETTLQEEYKHYSDLLVKFPPEKVSYPNLINYANNNQTISNRFGFFESKEEVEEELSPTNALKR